MARWVSDVQQVVECQTQHPQPHLVEVRTTVPLANYLTNAAPSDTSLAMARDLLGQPWGGPLTHTLKPKLR